MVVPLDRLMATLCATAATRTFFTAVAVLAVGCSTETVELGQAAAITALGRMLFALAAASKR
jgi:uncharacterized membrane protein YgdD (TMEM256/DUF423 family)